MHCLNAIYFKSVFKKTWKSKYKKVNTGKKYMREQMHVSKWGKWAI